MVFNVHRRWFVRCDQQCSGASRAARRRSAVESPPNECARRDAQQGARRGHFRSCKLGGPARQHGRCVASWDACLSRICAPCAIWPPFFRLSMRTRREQQVCMHCAARRTRHEERERRDCAIPLRVVVLLHGESRPLRGQNSGWVWTQIMILGVLDMPDHIYFT